MIQYGGNPVSCAIANAVMDVIRDERLQENALKVGQYLLEKCDDLRADFQLVGDVRGLGLFVGLELVRDRAQRTPATAEASFIVNRMKNLHHILISSDGPDENVLKLKPPMVFSQSNADEFIRAIRECLRLVRDQGVGGSGLGAANNNGAATETIGGDGERKNGSRH